MRYAALFSGGKDSTYAVFKTREYVTQLLSFKSKNKESYMFHYPNIDLTKTQAALMNLPIEIIETKGEKEKELADIENALKKYTIDGVVSGAVASNYQKERIDRICEKLGIKSIAPLWHKNQEEYMKELLENKFEIMITSVSCEGMDESWLGKIIDYKALDELIELQKKNKMNLSGEGGEYCTTVLACSLFGKHKIKVKKAQKIWEKDHGYFLIQDIEV